MAMTTPRATSSSACARSSGAKVPIGVELDPHCHLTEKRVRLSDIIILYKEYPHTDFVERAEELVTLIVKTIRGEIKPVMSLYDCRMIDLFPTSREPGRSLRRQACGPSRARTACSRSRSATSYAQGDVPEHGTRVLVVTDNAKAKGDALAPRARRGGARQSAAPGVRPISSSTRRSTAAYAEPKGPIVVADPSDNAGGGAASDNTNIIRRLLERGLSDAAVGPVWDPVAVQFCHAAGVGATLPLRFGGKTASDLGRADRRRSDGHRPRQRDGAQMLRQRQGAVRRRAPASASAASRSR